MEELDLLKKDWNKTNANFKEVSEKELYKMLHKNSSSIVKWILVISICEIFLWTAINIFSSNDEYFASSNYPDFTVYFDAFTIFNYIVVIGFVIQFYRNYKQISTVASTEKLMHTILKTRKTVSLYVKYNLFMILLTFLTGMIVVFTYNPKMEVIMEDPSKMLGVIVLSVIATTVMVGAFWLFYRLLYGILTKRLYENYKELKAIDF